MANYQESRVKLTNTKLNKLKSAAKNKRGTILRINNELKNWRILHFISNNKKNN